MYDTSVKEEDLIEALQNLQAKFEQRQFSFEIAHIAEGYQFLTKPEYQVSISLYLKQKSKRKLSTSALETLAIIAYKQPMTKTEVEQIRGVNYDYSV
jgi:segregation and condensation protein B